MVLDWSDEKNIRLVGVGLVGLFIYVVTAFNIVKFSEQWRSDQQTGRKKRKSNRPSKKKPSSSSSNQDNKAKDTHNEPHQSQPGSSGGENPVIPLSSSPRQESSGSQSRLPRQSQQLRGVSQESQESQDQDQSPVRDLGANSISSAAEPAPSFVDRPEVENKENGVQSSSSSSHQAGAAAADVVAAKANGKDDSAGVEGEDKAEQGASSAETKEMKLDETDKQDASEEMDVSEDGPQNKRKTRSSSATEEGKKKPKKSKSTHAPSEPNANVNKRPGSGPVDKPQSKRTRT